MSDPHLWLYVIALTLAALLIVFGGLGWFGRQPPSPVTPTLPARLSEVPMHALPPVSSSDPYAGLPGSHLLVPAPTVATSAGAVSLAEWLRRHAGRDGVWHEVTADFYARAVTVPEIEDYFEGVTLTRLQQHFAGALVTVMSRGLTVGIVRSMAAAHQGVHNRSGRPITGDIYDLVITTLAAVLLDHGVPNRTVDQVAVLAGPLRLALTTE